jgi:DNA-binding transcriptional LysR family regulator
MADVDLRKLRYFVAVAEQLHFGRAAEALQIAQPVLSRQIRALEDELKAQLFVREKRATELTPAGQQLLADARPLLASAEALRRRVARTARGQGSFTVGFMPGLIVTEAIRAMLDRHPRLDVTVLSTSWEDQTEVIKDGRADVSYLRLPADLRGLQVRELVAEPRVAALPAGQGIILLPASTAACYTRPGIAYLRVTDIPPGQVCLAWDATRRSQLIEDFADLAPDHLPVPLA